MIAASANHERQVVAERNANAAIDRGNPSSTSRSEVVTAGPATGYRVSLRSERVCRNSAPMSVSTAFNVRIH
jgi:hypothetical protein